MQHITSFIESQQQLHNPLLMKSDLPTQVSISPLVSTSSLPSIISGIDYEGAVAAVVHQQQAQQAPGTPAHHQQHQQPQQQQHNPQQQQQHPGQQSRQQGQRAKFPMNAFMIWSHESRQRMSEQNPSMHPTEIFKHLGNEWKKMTAADKKPYTDRAKRLWQQYKIDNPDYKLQFAKNRTKHQQHQQQLHQQMGMAGLVNPQMGLAGGVDIKAPSPMKRPLLAASGSGGGAMRGGMGALQRGGAGASGFASASTSAFNSTNPQGDESAPLGDMVSSTHRNLRTQGLVREAAQFKKYVLDLVSNYDFIMLEHRNS